ncbi:MAG TPA: hypothetical protein VIE66_03750 [Methylocella sp.]|jgi:hypothetical protein
MKRLDAANDNDTGKQIARTRQVWQPRIGRDLTCPASAPLRQFWRVEERRISGSS